MKFPSEDEFWYHFFDSKLGENFSLRHLQLFLNWKMGSTFHYGRLMHSLAVKRRASGLFNWIQIDCDWQTKLAVLSVQLQSKWIQLNRPKARLLARRPFNLRRSNVVCSKILCRGTNYNCEYIEQSIMVKKCSLVCNNADNCVTTNNRSGDFLLW